MGKGCFLDEWFEIQCNKSVDGHPRAFISKIKMELLNISVEGSANVKSPIISSDCSDRVSDLPFNLTGSPFFISDYNVFTAVGCNTRALMIHQSLQRLGCDSKCLSHKKDVDWRQMLPNFIEEDSSSNYLIADDYCNGTDCCQVTIPSSLQVFDPKFQAVSNQSTDGCKLAFLAGTYGRNSWRKKDPNVQFPMVLDWMLYSNRTGSYNWMIDSGLWSGNYSESESLACFPDGSSSINEAAVFWCYCRRGYEGNPYIGCTDVDECEDPKFRGHCKGITRCVNTSGSFKCVPDAKWIISLCTGGIIGVLVIVFGIQMLCKLMKKRKNIQLKKKFFERNGGLLLRQQLTSRSIAIDQTHLTTHVHGTFGYLDPEYFQSSQFTDKSDVYSFGVVLVELLSGQKPIYLSSSQETMSLATNFILLMEESRLFDIIDARITEDCHDKEIVAVANLAL